MDSPNSMADTVWLSRDGKMQGPFTPDQIDEMRASGELTQFMWIWNGADEGWTSLHALPPAPPATSTQSPTAAGATQANPSQNAAQPSMSIPPRPSVAGGPPSGGMVFSGGSRATSAGVPVTAISRSLSVVCHDNKNVMGGVIQSRIGDDFILQSADFAEETPPFRKTGKVSIHLLEEASGKTENSSAEIVEFRKVSEGWEYRLKWQSTPQLLQN